MKNLAISFLCVCILTACEDAMVENDVSSDQSPIETSAITVEEAEAFFLKDLKGLDFDYNSEESIWIPIWSGAYAYTNDSTSLLEVPLFHIGKNLPENITRNLLFFQNEEDGILQALVKEVVTDTTVVEEVGAVDSENFTGYVIYHDWFSDPLFGYQYMAGQIVSSITDISGGLSNASSSNSRQQKSNGCFVSNKLFDCTETWSFTPSGGWHYNGKICDQVIIEFTCTGSIVPLSDGTTVRTSGGIGLRDSNTNVVKHPSGIIMGSNLRPCIAKIVQSVSKAIEVRDHAANAAVRIMQRGANPFNMYRFLQQVYDSKSPLNIEIKEANLAGANATTYTGIREVNGEKIISVALDRNYLSKATDLSIARTIIHESIHAMFLYGMSLALDDSQAFRDANQVLYNPNGTSGTTQQAQHEQMALTYVDEIADILSSYAQRNNISTPNTTRRSYVEYLAYGGLTGTQGWKALKNYNQTTAKNIIAQEADRKNTKGTRNASC